MSVSVQSHPKLYVGRSGLARDTSLQRYAYIPNNRESMSDLPKSITPEFKLMTVSLEPAY